MILINEKKFVFFEEKSNEYFSHSLCRILVHQKKCGTLKTCLFEFTLHSGFAAHQQ